MGITTDRRGGAAPATEAVGLAVDHTSQPAMPHARRLTTALVVIDILALAAVGSLRPESWVTITAFGVVVLCLGAVLGGYSSRLTLSAVDELPHLVGRALLAGAVVTIGGILVSERSIRVLLVAITAYTLIVLPARALLYWQVRRLRRQGAIVHPTVILGAGQVGAQVAETLITEPEYGLIPVGFLDDDPYLSEQDRVVPVLGETSQLGDVLLKHDVSNVVVAFSAVDEPRLVDLVRTCDRLSCEIFFVPRLFEVYGSGQDVDRIGSLPIIRLRRAAFRSFTWRLKRLFDVLGSLAAMVVLAPVLIGCALATWISIGRPILYRQSRVGLDGYHFEVLKFRSLAADDGHSGHQWNIASDDRLRRVGRVLRKTSLDELPQLWNVVRGDMSLVGPRPERPQYVEEFAHRYPRYLARHRVPCGITGWAQVNGLRGDTSIEARVRYDNYYIENWSLWGDIKILVRTFGQVVRGAGA